MYISDITELVILNDAIIDDINVLTIDNCLFEENLALFGGALYINVDYDENDLQYPTGNETTLPPKVPSIVLMNIIVIQMNISSCHGVII